MNNDTTSADIIEMYNDYKKIAGGVPEAAATLVLAHVLLSYDDAVNNAIVQDLAVEPSGKPVSVTVSINGEDLVPEVMG